MEAIILAGGKGTRLQSVVNDVPKPMANINGKPFLAYLIHSLSTKGVTKIILSVGYKHDAIMDYFLDCYDGISINYAIEDEPLGTGGALAKSLEQVSTNNILLLNGDSFFDVDVKQLYQQHALYDCDVTLSLKEMHNFDRYGTVAVQNNWVINFEEKVYKSCGLINGGVYVLKRSLLATIPHEKIFSFEADILQKYFNQLSVGAYIDSGYFIDIGVPEDYLKAQKDFDINFGGHL